MDKPIRHSFWQRWIRPRIWKLTVKDWTFWLSFLVGVVTALWPIFPSLRLLRGVTVESLAVAVVTFAAIGLGISVALGALVVTFPSGRLRTAMQASVSPSPSAYLELAFLAFWAGASNIAAAVIALAALVFAGPYCILSGPDVLPAVASGLIFAATLHALLQMLSALIALLEAAGLSERFNR